MPPKASNTAWATTGAGRSFSVGETEFIALSVLLCRRYSRIHDNFHESILLYHSNSHSRRVEVSHVRRNIPAMVFGQAIKGSLCRSLGKPCLAGDLVPGAACFAEGCTPGCVGVSLAMTLADRRINNLQQDFQSLIWYDAVPCSLLFLWIGALIRLFRSQGNLVLENLVLRQQLAVLKRRHPRPSLGLLDKLF
jgi:hypothetical protein